MVERALRAFLAEHTPLDCSTVAIDGTLVEYLLGVLYGCSPDDFDVEELADMCEAYIPALKGLSSRTREALLDASTTHTTEVCEPVTSDQASESTAPTMTSSSCPVELSTISSSAKGASSKKSSGSTDSKKKRFKEARTHSSNISESSEPVDVLADIFPGMTRLQLEESLSLAGGDFSQAVDLLVERSKNATQSFPNENHSRLNKLIPDSTGLDDQSTRTDELNKNSGKNQCDTNTQRLSSEERMAMFERYGLVQTSTNQPASMTGPPISYLSEKKAEKQSNIRYLDGKVVDTKGKKYIEIKPEYPDMPQPSFLKALRRYKFH